MVVAHWDKVHPWPHGIITPDPFLLFLFPDYNQVSRGGRKAGKREGARGKGRRERGREGGEREMEEEPCNWKCFSDFRNITIRVNNKLALHHSIKINIYSLNQI